MMRISITYPTTPPILLKVVKEETTMGDEPGTNAEEVFAETVELEGRDELNRSPTIGSED